SLKYRSAESIRSDLWSEQLGKVSVALRGCGNRCDRRTGRGSARHEAVDIQGSIKERLVSTVVDFRNVYRTADGETGFVLLVRCYGGRKEISRLQRVFPVVVIEVTVQVVCACRSVLRVSHTAF